MKKAILFDFTVDKENRKIHVKRRFEAPLDLVWAAWTDQEILDLWWAPKPWRAETKFLDFREGGRWLYNMIGPNGEGQWCFFEYNKIMPMQSFTGYDAFCDEEEVVDHTKPKVDWNNQFSEEDGESTLVDIELGFGNLSDLEAIIQMGFKEGFTIAMEGLDEIFAKKRFLQWLSSVFGISSVFHCIKNFSLR